MWNKPRIMSHLPDTRLVLRGTISVAIVTLAAGLPLGDPAVADEPFQVVAVSGTVACGDYKLPELFGSSIKISGPGPHFVNFGPGLRSQVTIDVFDNTSLDFEVTSGPDLVDVFVVKGSADAQQYAYLGASFDEGLTTANVQKIQNVTVCADGETLSLTNASLPSCNVGDNRAEVDECTQGDKDIGALIFKYASVAFDGVEQGQAFFCQCGDIDVQTFPELKPLGNATAIDELDSIGLVSTNPICFVWSIVGGKKECKVPDQ